jgi:hypothetical protein
VRSDQYYWAGGRKVPLSSDPHFAVDKTSAQMQGLWDGELASAADTAGHHIGDGLVMLPKDAVSSDLRGQLDQTGASAPVYRAGEALIAVLPQVRVEVTPDTSTSDVRGAIADIDAHASVTEPAPGRLVVTPSSGRGADALELANQIVERLRPEAAQARFVRIMPTEHDTNPEE